MPLIVQKYGWTSVSTEERRQKDIQKILAARAKGYDVVVVVSAMGRRGEPYATDTFLDMLKGISAEPQERTKDLLASCGEIISCCVVAEALERHGCPAIAMTGFQAGILTDQTYTNGLVLSVDPGRIRKALSEHLVVVAAGFQGCDRDQNVVTLGRGGSDTTAIALGGALEADVVEIYTDVPGIAYTDPRIISSAPYLTSIDFQPMYILARTGAKVIHYRALETAMKFNRPFSVRSTFTDGEGTLIGKPGEAPGGMFGMALLKDMYLVRKKSGDPEKALLPLAADSLFYRNDARGCTLVCTEHEVKLLKEYGTPDTCDILTLQWHPAAGITPTSVSGVLANHNVAWKEYFPVPGGGSWAIPSQQAKEAMLALFRA
jgi:aspartate kinase